MQSMRQHDWSDTELVWTLRASWMLWGGEQTRAAELAPEADRQGAGGGVGEERGLQPEDRAGLHA